MSYPEIFNRCIKVVLRNEGGYVNDPDDPGGETNMGIAKRFYPNEDIKNMTVERATEIFFKDYWTPMNLYGIEDDNLILQVFDFGVNVGVRTAVKLLQRIVGVTDDGKVGPITLAAVNSYEGDLHDKFKRRRKLFYMSLAAKKPVLEKFLNGWIRRVDRTKFKNIR